MSPEQPTVVHLVRHGEVYNPDAVLYSRLPGFHLSANGRTMADVVASYFAESDLTHLASSPLERARETLEIIAAHHPDLPLGIDENLIEADSVFAGQVFGPKALALRAPRNWRFLANPRRPSWGEPYDEIAARMLMAIADAARAAGDGGEALVVSHQLPIEIARRAVEGRPLPHLPTTRRCTLASITTFEVSGNGIRHTGYAEPALGLIPVKARKDMISAGA